MAVLIPVFAEAAVFLIIPILGTISISLMEYNPLAHTMFFRGLENYAKLPDDPDFAIALKNTLVFTFTAVAINIVIALTIAVLICQMKSNKTRSFFRMIVFLPCMAPMVASAVVWARSILNTKIGLVNQLAAFFLLTVFPVLHPACYPRSGSCPPYKMGTLAVAASSIS